MNEDTIQKRATLAEKTVQKVAKTPPKKRKQISPKTSPVIVTFSNELKVDERIMNELKRMGFYLSDPRVQCLSETEVIIWNKPVGK